MIGSGGEDSGNIARLGQRVTPRNVKGQSIFKNPAGMDQGHRSIAQGVGVELAGRKTVGVFPETRCREVYRLLEIAILCLEVMRTEVHSFGPYDSGKRLHAHSPGELRWEFSPEPAALETRIRQQNMKRRLASDARCLRCDCRDVGVEAEGGRGVHGGLPVVGNLSKASWTASDFVVYALIFRNLAELFWACVPESTSTRKAVDNY